MLSHFLDSLRPDVVLLLGAAGLYVTVQSLIVLAIRRGGEIAQAAAGLTGVAILAGWSAWAGRFDLAAAVCLSSAIALLTLVRGASILSARASTRLGSPAQQFVLPLGLLIHLMGFRAVLGPMQAAWLLAAGLAIGWVWAGSAGRHRGDPILSGGNVGRLGSSGPVPNAPANLGLRRLLTMIGLWLLPALIGGWMVVHAVWQLGQSTRTMGDGLLMATLVAATAILPVVGLSSRMAIVGESDRAIRLATGMALASMGIILPLAMFAAWGVSAGELAVAGMGSLASSDTPGRAVGAMRAAMAASVRFPLAIWRVETVALLVIGIPLLATAGSIAKASRRQGIGWVLAFAAYMLLVGLTAALRRGIFP